MGVLPRVPRVLAHRLRRHTPPRRYTPQHPAAHSDERRGLTILERFGFKRPRTQVVAGLLRREGQVLLGHRTPHRSHYPDVWDLPGGRVERGESLVEALTRELKEELGVVTNLAGEASWLTLTDDTLQLHIFLVDDWLGEPSNMATNEHDEIKWTAVSELADLDLAHSSYLQILIRALS